MTERFPFSTLFRPRCLMLTDVLFGCQQEWAVDWQMRLDEAVQHAGLDTGRTQPG